MDPFTGQADIEDELIAAHLAKPAAPAVAEEVPPKRKRKKGRMISRRLRRSPEERRWHMWDHDFDAAMHGLVQNPAVVTMTPHQVVQFAAGIADAMSVEQDKRNPDRFESNRY